MVALHRHYESSGKFVSLYTGAGGLDIGFYLAGYDPVWSNDIDPASVKTYRGLFPEHTSTVGDLLKQILPKVKDLDLVVGGPPCQGFSVAGKMDPHDPRSKHVWNFLGAVAKLEPKGFVMENVKSLGSNKRWQPLIEQLRSKAEKMGYITELLILNSAHYEVPQARERMFLVGLDCAKVNTPKTVTEAKPITVREALKALPPFGRPGNNSICTAKITPAKKPVLRLSPYAGMLFNGQGRPLNLNAPSLTLPASMGGNRTPIIDQQQLTIDSIPWIEEYHKHLCEGGKPVKTVPEYLRRITVEEAAVLQSFPKGMKFEGSQSAQYRQIGNAVPPILAYHLALTIIDTLNDTSLDSTYQQVVATSVDPCVTSLT